MKDLQDAISIAIQFQKRTLNPVQALENAFEKIQHTESVYIECCEKRAYREAKAAKERWDAGQPLSIFDGIPISWKDLFNIQGYKTTAGSPVLNESELKTSDASMVATLTQQGMVNVGKTNLSEFAYSGLGLNPYFGHPKNIYDQTCVSGGSSSGAAISVGVGTVPLAMGSDTAGSIRIPAAFNGLVGYRSSYTRYAKDGVFELAKTLDTLGPLALTVRDCKALDNLLLGKKSFDIPQVQVKPQQLSFVVDERVFSHPQTCEDVKNNFAQSVEKLKEQGCLVEYRPIDAFQQSLDLVDDGLWLGAAEAFTLHEKLLDSSDAEKMDQYIRARLETARHFPASKQIKLYFLKQQLQQKIRAELDGSLLLTPTVMHTAPKLAPLLDSEETFFSWNKRSLRLTMPGSFLDTPAITVPNGFCKQGLPTGLLISSYSGDDEAVFRAAHFFEGL